jgi:hypothetical protein
VAILTKAISNDVASLARRSQQDWRSEFSEFFADRCYNMLSKMILPE